ncbi:hypothetical protein IFM89_000164 [Coptis chinensis]|uniref:EXS domain-containing protein n=1 Tax=Coptis chinensis TaxID=261450 RepID=A0A835H5B5_9MAGN|nr:hypothetical protein IFM89_000164 [Coptis chinensis]
MFMEVFLVSTALATLALAAMLSNLNMEMDPKTKDYKALTELVPLGLATLVLLITFCPFNFIYCSSRFFVLNCVFCCICAPLYKVQAIRSPEFYICYYGWGDFKHRQNTCKDSAICLHENSVHEAKYIFTSSAIAATVSTYWDIVIDWGLLQRHSKNTWLRDKLLVSQKNVYYGAMVALLISSEVALACRLGVEVAIVIGGQIVFLWRLMGNCYWAG